MTVSATEQAETGRVTISDLSRALGLTKGTVSRALNGYTDISESTRLRVSRMADRMGYRPLSQAQAIRTGLSRSIGFIIQSADHDSHRPFLAEFLAGASGAASTEGWTLTVAASEGSDDTLSVMRALVRDRKADGFILPRTLPVDPRIALLRRLDVPFVLFGRTADPEGCAWHDYLGEAAMSGAVARLAAMGHRRIGFVNGGAVYNYSALRRQGFLDGMATEGLPVAPELMLEDAATREKGRAAAVTLLRRPEPPTAVVCAVDQAALGVYDAAAALGLTPGREVSVISYDGLPEGQRATPPLSSYAVDIRGAGARLGKLLIRRIRGEPPEALRETVEATYLPGGSAQPPALTPAALAAVIAGRAQ